jgi:hypothetical protein
LALAAHLLLVVLVATLATILYFLQLPQLEADTEEKELARLVVQEVLAVALEAAVLLEVRVHQAKAMLVVAQTPFILLAAVEVQVLLDKTLGLVLAQKEATAALVLPLVLAVQALPMLAAALVLATITAQVAQVEAVT